MTAESKPDIIMLALPRWDGPYSSTAFSMAKELSRYSRVFYVDNPFTAKDYFANRKSKQIRKRRNALLFGRDIFFRPDEKYPNLIAVSPRFTLPINWLPKGMVYNFLSRINDSILQLALTETIKEFRLTNYIFINSFNPLFGRFFSSSLSPSLTIYHCVDDISQSEYISKHGTELEESTIRKADITLVTSTELMRLKSQYSRHVYNLPNAADVNLFQRAVKEDLPVPAEIKDIVSKRKIITYAGNICHRLDYELLVKLANSNSDKTLLMIGPFANENYKKAGLDKLPNVIFTGRKSIDELPYYFKYSDCCIIPFLCIPLTRSIYPLKINEYLSAGKPVVTTNFSADIANFGEVAYVAVNHEDFIHGVDKVISTDDANMQRARIAYSANNSWEARAKQFWDIVQKPEMK